MILSLSNQINLQRPYVVSTAGVYCNSVHMLDPLRTKNSFSLGILGSMWSEVEVESFIYDLKRVGGVKSGLTVSAVIVPWSKILRVIWVALAQRHQCVTFITLKLRRHKGIAFF